MGNALGGKKTTKVMKISGETLKLKTPVRAGEVVKDYPGHVLLESEAVKHFGIRAKALEAQQELQAKRLYFLVELPKSSKEKNPRRVRSGINMSAKDRLESLMLSRRSTSDLSIIKQSSCIMGGDDDDGGGGDRDSKAASGSENGGVRFKLKVRKGEVEKLMKECKDEAEAAERIMGLCLARRRAEKEERSMGKGKKVVNFGQQSHWNDCRESRGNVGDSVKAREKRVSFKSTIDAEKQIAVASY